MDNFIQNNSKPLPAKMEAFCLNWIETGHVSESYKKAGYKMTNPKTVSEAASRLLRNSKVVARIKELQMKHVERHNITVDSLVDDLETDRQLARTLPTPQVSAAISATMGKAKILGFLDEDSHTPTEVNVRYSMDDNMLEIARRIAFVLARGSGRIINHK